jgi:hypothetical protein
MAAFRTSRTFDVIFLSVLGLVVWWSVVNRVAIGDTLFFLRFEPPAQTVQTASAAGLNDAGRRLLYRTDPVFTGQAEIDKECDTERLGCLSSKGQAFILDDPAKPSQAIVTAAHEMLHLAYRRLSAAKKAELAPILDQAITQNALEINPELQSSTTDEDRRDEAHSLLGTEYRELPAALETYYDAYFSDRAKVVDAAQE